MAFAVEDFEDLIRLLAEHPEWRQRLREQILDEQFLELPAIVHQLVEGQARLEAAIERLESLGREHSERMDGLDGRMDRIEIRMDSLERNLTGRMDSLERNLTTRMDEMTTEFGMMYQNNYLFGAQSYFGDLLRHPRTVGPGDVDEVEKALKSGLITRTEFRQVLALDLLVRGIDREVGGRTYLAVEVSRTINREDVQRAAARAAILAKVGLNARPVVGGARITSEAQRMAEEAGAAVVLVRE